MIVFVMQEDVHEGIISGDLARIRLENLPSINSRPLNVGVAHLMEWATLAQNAVTGPAGLCSHRKRLSQFTGKEALEVAVCNRTIRGRILSEVSFLEPVNATIWTDQVA